MPNRQPHDPYVHCHGTWLHSPNLQGFSTPGRRKQAPGSREPFVWIQSAGRICNLPARHRHRENFLSRNLRPCRRKVTAPAAMPATGRQSAATLSSLTDNQSYQYLFFSHERLFDAAKLEYNYDIKVQSESHLYLFEISYYEYDFFKHLQLLIL